MNEILKSIAGNIFGKLGDAFKQTGIGIAVMILLAFIFIKILD